MNKFISKKSFFLILLISLLIFHLFITFGDSSPYGSEDPYACSPPCGSGKHCEWGQCVDDRPTTGNPTKTYPDGTTVSVDLDNPSSNPCPNSNYPNYWNGGCYGDCKGGKVFLAGNCIHTISSCESAGLMWCDQSACTTKHPDTACDSNGFARTCQLYNDEFWYNPNTESCETRDANGKIISVETYNDERSNDDDTPDARAFTSGALQSNCSDLSCDGDNKFPYHVHTINPSEFNDRCSESLMFLTELNNVKCKDWECGGCIFSWGEDTSMRCANHNHNMCGLTVKYYDCECGSGDKGGCGGGASMRDHNHEVTGTFEADTSEECCVGCGKTWIDNTCCGDDASEILSHRKVAQNSNLKDFYNDINDRACCPSDNNCVFNGMCYSPQTSPINVDGHGGEDYCNENGEWQDLPSTCDGTNKFCLCNVGKVGLCDRIEGVRTCYCDFEGIYIKDSTNPIILFSSPPTPKSTFDEYIQKQQSKIEIKIHEPSLTSFKLRFINQETNKILDFPYDYLDRVYSSGFEAESDLGRYSTSSATLSTDGKYGNALSFDGTKTLTLNNFYNPNHDFPLLLGSKTENNFNGDASYTAWVKPTKLDSENRHIFSDSNDNEGFIRMHNDKLIALFGEGNSITYNKNFEENQWYHVAMTHQREDSASGLYKLNLYLDGELIGTSTSSSSATYYGPDDKLVIGQNFIGLIDEVQIYNSVLDEQRIKFIYASFIKKEGSVSTISLDLSKFQMEKVTENYFYYVTATDFSDQTSTTASQEIKLFDIENNQGKIEVKSSKIKVNDKTVNISYLIKNIGDNAFIPSIILPQELDDFYVQTQVDYLEIGKELWMNLTLITKSSNLGEYTRGYDLYNYTRFYLDGSLIKLYKLRDYNTALFRDTLNKKDVTLNYDFDVEISSGDRSQTQNVNFDIDYFCGEERFILDLLKNKEVYYCLCGDKGFCLDDRPCACIAFPERFVDSTKDKYGERPKVYFNAQYSFDPRTSDEKGENLYYEWHMVGLEEANKDSVKIKEGKGLIEEGAEESGAEFELTIRQDGDYYASVSVSSNEKEDSDFVNFLFSPRDLPFCQRDGSKWIIGGEEIQIINSLDNCFMENGYNKKTCCPAGYRCENSICVASLDYNDCGDYKTRETCEADEYNLGLKSVEDINGEYFCSSIQFLDQGRQVYIQDCSCSWNEDQNNCGTKFNQTGYFSGGSLNSDLSGSCEMKVNNVIGNCDTDEFKVYNIEAAWNSPSPRSTSPVYCKNQTKKIECGNLVLLNFFDTTQIILTILVIVLVYLIIFRIKKNKN